MSYVYQTCLGGFLVLCTALLFSQPTRKEQLKHQDATNDEEHPETWWYKVYALAVAADWLQGPYLFTLYKDEHGLESGLVMSLYITDFVTTAVSAYIVGALSDKYGRKLFCMVYCVSYALSCFLTVVPVTPLLFLGRVLGGVSTSILFTVFDSWMVANFSKKNLAENGCDLSRTYAATSVINSLVALLSGVAGEILVWITGTKKSPFIMSVVLLWLTLQAIWSHWSENFGVSSSSEPKTYTATLRSHWSALKTPSILALTVASTMFDGAMYLFLFYWTPTISSVQASASELPYGTIYSTFMAASMAGALAFNIIINKRMITYSPLLTAILLVANLCFVKLANVKTEAGAFGLFCLLEACVGLFAPCIGYLKGTLIDDDNRATVYSMMRIPFNCLAIVSLLTAKDNNNIGGVFTTCSLMLTASIATTLAASLRGML
ncbi:hypothetical protein F5Y01DRAFT_296603 [Xylaria sp. FL0043]|nr:hypothetical protein F5Y01DRAFT_296603 [Xylaria sp. FL0043]